MVAGNIYFKYALFAFLSTLISWPVLAQDFRDADGVFQEPSERQASSWEEQVDQAAQDSSLDQDGKREVYASVMESQCMRPQNPECIQVFEHLDRLCKTDDDKAWLMFIHAELLAGSTSMEQSARLYQEVADKYPGTDYAAQALTILYEISEAKPSKGTEKSSGGFIDVRVLAAAQDAFIRKAPTHKEAPAIAEQRVNLQAKLGNNFSELESLLRFYKLNPGANFPARLAYPLKILNNLQQPVSSIIMSLLIIFIPVYIFIGARMALFNAQKPEAGWLTPPRAKALQWALAVSLVPLAVAVNILYTPGEIIMIDLLGKPFDLRETNMIPGASIVGYALILMPMITLVLLNAALTTAGVNRLEPKGRSLPWYLPQDYQRAIIIYWAIFTVSLVVLFHILFNGYFFAATAIGLSFLAPSFFIIIHLISPLYATGAFPEGALKDYILQTCQQLEVPVKDIRQAKFSFKMLDGMTIANIFGPARIYLDPDLLRLLSKNEFHTILVHNIAHLKLEHRVKVTAAGLAITGFLVLLVILGSLSPALAILVPGRFLNIAVTLSMFYIARWDINNDREADEFVLKKTQMFPDYINAILKLNGLIPSEVDLARIDFIPTLNKAKKQRINFILDEWRRAVPKTPPQQQQPQPKPKPVEPIEIGE